jgi:hypothetical protein
MSMNPYWQIIGLVLLIGVCVLIHKSSRYSEEDICLDKDIYRWEVKEIWPISFLENYIEDTEEQIVQISKINVQQPLNRAQRLQFYINAAKVEAKGAIAHARNDKYTDGRPNANSFNRIIARISANSQ